VLSSITHSALLDVVIVYQEFDFNEVVESPNRWRSFEIKKGIPQNRQRQFEVFHKMHKVRDFRLVFCADIFDFMTGNDAVEQLEHLVKKEEEKGGFDYLLHEPLVISGRRTPRSSHLDNKAGWSVEMPISASAL